MDISIISVIVLLNINKLGHFSKMTKSVQLNELHFKNKNDVSIRVHYDIDGNSDYECYVQ